MILLKTAFVILSALMASGLKLRAANPEAFMHPIWMIKSYGYPAELHRVVTADGYVLEIHRIPGRRGSVSVPVVIQHGLFSSTADFLSNRPPRNLPCLLWDHDYDVWLSNTRGNMYARSHIKYKLDDPRFWDFYVDDFARFDLPAVISYVQRETGYTRIHYIGHSQGTQSMFALLSTRPAFAQNLRMFSAMAPVASIAHVTSPLTKSIPFFSLVKALHPNGRVRTTRLNKYGTLCQISRRSQRVCAYVTDIIYGPNRKSQDRQRSDVYYSHFPQDVSIKNSEHLKQLNSRVGFRMFDYGPEINLRKYGTAVPPSYPLSRIRNVRISLYFAQNDNLVEKRDADFLLKSLQPSVLYDVYTIPKDPQFTHNDFQWGTRSLEYVWGRMIKNMENVDQLESMDYIYGRHRYHV
ncbi:gastric triacylglycerol lipase-like isoform X2 [Varroa jacobsoni]|uniref:gastric triacylglycerol lipase-like isoform X2 n=1 Tax=Varroa jacobsoni TaxID=62625 RepID=UPI000BF403B5|nr:gastric triacylglycerol lipase-like isoform X2 [Varroa jacobsoni]XP_022711765.1 gastric triacylglycerol lipase-like isoform X2 [Varroa jacobsoni]